MLLILTIICISFAIVSCETEGSEPMCLSRYDYDYKVLSKLVDLDNRLKQAGKTSDQLGQKIELQEEKIKSLSALLDAERSDPRKPGGVYVRWGKTSCPRNGTEMVYSGYAGGSWYHDTGAAVDYICLPKEPLWNKYKDGVDGVSGFVYGSEYQLDQRDLTSFFGRNIHDDNVPCAVCRTERSSVLMIPARNQCFGGWTVEYHGYMSSSYVGHNAASEYVCLDSEPDSLPNTKTSHDGKLFYFVEARCGSLPCPPYVEGRELTCVVCSK